MFGSAAAIAGYPVARAYYELLERVGLLLATRRPGPFPAFDSRGIDAPPLSHAEVFPPNEAPELRRYSLSNGVALHRTPEAARASALAELVERDSVLRSFAGGPAPKRLHAAEALFPLAEMTVTHEPLVVRFSATPPHCVAGVFGFPRHADVPLFYGFAAATSEEAAVSRAIQEAVQRLGFLLGEPIPSHPPELAPTPDFHQELYLCPDNHSVLRDWLEGRRERLTEHPVHGEPRFAILTPRSLDGAVCLVRALCNGMRPLVFGANDDPSTHPHPIA
jgi:hypothetical protein